MTESDQYKKDFCQKFTPWLESRWKTNPIFRRWVSLADYKNEDTHGLGHSATVRSRANSITGQYLSLEERDGVDNDLLDVMALFHDMARFVRYPAGDKRGEQVINKREVTKSQYRAQRCVFPHELTGAALARIVCNEDDYYFEKLIIEKGIGVFRQLLSHDYHSPEVTPYCDPPVTLEAQIFCVADKTSIDPLKEAERRHTYLTTRPINPVPLFDPTLPIEERRKWNFAMVARDALCAIIPILNFKPEVFATHEGIKRYYGDWSKSLRGVVDYVVVAAEAEGGQGLKRSVAGILDNLAGERVV